MMLYHLQVLFQLLKCTLYGAFTWVQIFKKFSNMHPLDDIFTTEHAKHHLDSYTISPASILPFKIVIISPPYIMVIEKVLNY